MFWDSEESKTVDTTGTVNNNVVVSNPIELHDNAYYLLVLLCVLKLIEVAYLLFSGYRRQLKKKLLKTQANNHLLSNVNVSKL